MLFFGCFNQLTIYLESSDHKCALKCTPIFTSQSQMSLNLTIYQVGAVNSNNQPRQPPLQNIIQPPNLSTIWQNSKKKCSVTSKLIFTKQKLNLAQTLAFQKNRANYYLLLEPKMFTLNKNFNLALLCTLQTQHEHMSDAGRTLIEVIFQCTTTTMIQSIS